MKARLLAIAAFLATLAGGSIVYVNWSDGTEATLVGGFGAFEVVDKSRCDVSACNAAQCQQARNILIDGGSEATLVLAECPVRFGQKARNLASDAGIVFSAAKYQQVRFVAMKLGTSYAVAVDDAGWPVHAVAAINQPCAWKPAGGSNCTRGDAGDPGFENVMQPGDWVGAGCVRKSCVIVAGDSNE